jgi:hypothetical protein
LHRDIPTLDGVALSAIRPHLPAVDIRVTIGAILAHIGERGLYMALCTLHFFVQTTERILRFVVVEFGDRADRAPPCRRVTVFTRNVQRAVWISLGFLLCVARTGCRGCSTVGPDGRGGGWYRQQSPERELDYRERIALPPRDTNTYRGGTVEIVDTFCGGCRGLTTVRLYSCRTVDSSFPRSNWYCRPRWGLGFSLRLRLKGLPRIF